MNWNVLHIAIVGDIKHSRVARSDVWAFTAMGARVTLVAPPTLLPPSLEGWPVTVSHDLDAVLDVLPHALRLLADVPTDTPVFTVTNPGSGYDMVGPAPTVAIDGRGVGHFGRRPNRYSRSLTRT